MTAGRRRLCGLLQSLGREPFSRPELYRTRKPYFRVRRGAATTWSLAHGGGKSAILLWRGADAPVKGCSNRGWRADADPHAAALEFAGSAFRHACLVCGWDADLAASAEGRPPPIR